MISYPYNFICLFNKGNIVGITSSQFVFVFMYTCMLFYICAAGADLVDLRKVLKCAFAYDSLIIQSDPVWLTGRDVKI